MTDFNLIFYEIHETKANLVYFFIKEESAKVYRIWLFDVPARFLTDFDFMKTSDILYSLCIDAIKKEYKDGNYKITTGLNLAIFSNGVKMFSVKRDDIQRLLIDIRIELEKALKKQNKEGAPEMSLNLLQEM